MINVQKLQMELDKAGIPNDGCDSNGGICFTNATDQQEKLAAQIVKSHNPDWYVEKRIVEYKSISDQLDMIYWDKMNGTTMWIDHITEVKKKYPK